MTCTPLDQGAQWWLPLLDLGHRLAGCEDPGTRGQLIVSVAGACLSGVEALWIDVERRGSANPAGWLGGLHGADVALIRQALSDGQVHCLPRSSQSPTSLALPAVAGGRVLGVLLCRRNDGAGFSKTERRTAVTLIHQAAVGLQAASSAQEVRLLAAELDWISGVRSVVSRVIRDQPDVDRTIAAATRLVPMLAGVERCVALTIQSGAGIRLHSSYGLDDGELRSVGDACKLMNLKALRSSSFSSALTHPLSLEESGRLAAAGFPSGLLFPVFDGPDLHSLLLVDCPDSDAGSALRTGPAPARTRALVEAIASSASSAVDLHTLRRIQQEDAYVSVALLQVARVVAGLAQLDEILDVVSRLTLSLVGADRCLIASWDDEASAFGRARIQGLPGVASGVVDPQQLSYENSPLLWQLCLPQGSPASLGRPNGNSGVRRLPVGNRGGLRQLLRLEPGSGQEILALPLVARGRFAGALVVAEGVAEPRSAERRSGILQGIADQAAIAIHNDRLQSEASRRQRLEQEMELARDIQKGLMPARLPLVPGWEVAASCLPAREVGGDFYDVFELAGSGLGLVIADVADKGMPAALFMANARAMIRAVAAYHISPQAVLAEVNRMLVPDSHRSMFVTAFYGMLWPDSGVLDYCNAGHNRPLVWRCTDSQVSCLESGGTALGVVDDPVLTHRCTRLEAGDWLVLYTDGITEAYSPSQVTSFGDQRMRDIVQANASGEVTGMLRAIHDAVQSFVGETPQSDDQTMLVLRRRPSDPR